MRTLSPAFIATSVALALAGTAAQAQTTAPRAVGPSVTTTTTSSSTGTVGPALTGVSPGTTVGTSISGTSSGDAFTGSSRSPTSGQTSGTSISGTSSGDAFTGSSRGNAPGVGSALEAGTTNSLQRDASGALFNANGERIVVPIINPDTGAIVSGGGIVSGSAGTDMGSTAANANVNGNAAVDARAAAVTSTPELDAATRREARRARAVVERKGQMMQSIAPRTNVDRTDQMPDDATPLLSPARR